MDEQDIDKRNYFHETQRRQRHLIILIVIHKHLIELKNIIETNYYRIKKYYIIKKTCWRYHN